MLSNLIGNAIKYGRADGSVRVEIAEGPDHKAIVLAVRDDGAGIPAADLDRIFDEFYRSTAATGSSPGSGLGLAIVARVVERARGHIGVESTLGKGTTFTVTLPAAD